MIKDLIIFIDSGDTLVDESTEIRDETGTVIHASLFSGAHETMLELYESGYKIALVADGTKASFDNIFKENNLEHCFAARAISGELGKEKPSDIMFLHAMKELGLGDTDKSRIVMIGNNLKRDVVGANRMGIISILAGYSPRYDMQPKNDEEIPDYVIANPSELIGLLNQLDIQVKNRRILNNN
ncbi:MAG: hydrolase [Herbinix sp.]|jgi:putative hydrolase of the HAD superfamily|nr:hydrolase [Herbinix sp.]